MRDGTDSVFVRLEQDGVLGYGEATLPPYLPETQASVIARINAIRLPDLLTPEDTDAAIGLISAATMHAPAARNAVTMAVLDMAAQMTGQPLWRFLRLPEPPGASKAMVTLACDRLGDLEPRLEELPVSDVLKVKLGTIDDREQLKSLIPLDNRPLLLDANQSIGTIEHALELIELAGGTERVIAMEQPFGKARLADHVELQARTPVPVILDESIQDPADLQAVDASIGGVNLKLMKCGGLVGAVAMAAFARAKGVRVMLGSMSESSLGCSAMAHLSGAAELVDLDGPWLVSNDPFGGIGEAPVGRWKPQQAGIGAALGLPIQFTPIAV